MLERLDNSRVANIVAKVLCGAMIIFLECLAFYTYEGVWPWQ